MSTYRHLLLELRHALHRRHHSGDAWRHCSEVGLEAMKHDSAPIGVQFKYLTDDTFAERFFVDLERRVDVELKTGDCEDD